jgi:hypothetical protein
MERYPRTMCDDLLTLALRRGSSVRSGHLKAPIK